MKIHLSDFRAPEEKKIHLKDWPTSIRPVCGTREQYQALLQKHVQELEKMQQMLYASGTHALLIILQGIDAAGKDSTIRHVMSGVNPQGCDVFGFKQPSPQELKHDFLWRASLNLPERGKIAIFNRSYYEEVLITRVHPGLIRQENLPDDDEEDIWERRYASINAFERHLHENSTRIIKIFLHLSREEQKKRFLERIDNPNKNWKLSASDIRERAHWKRYRHAYEKCLSATSRSHAPWHIVPADDKLSTGLIVSRIILDTMRSLKLAYPAMTGKRLRELKEIRAMLK